MRRSLLLGGAFAALLFVTAIAAFAIWQNTINAQNRIAELHSSHLEAGIALAAIRSDVYLIGILTRDYLLDSNPGHREQYERQFRAIGNDISSKFPAVEKAIQEERQRTALGRLRRGVDAYWDPTALVLNWTSDQKSSRREDFLRERVGRRQEITELAGEIDGMMSENFSREKERTAKADVEFRSSLEWTLGASLLLSLIIAGVTMARSVMLERRSAIAESALRRLSVQVRSTQERERKHLSRELHDQVGQMLTGLRLELSGLPRLQGNSELHAGVEHAKSVVEQILRIVRNFAMLLRPPMLDDLGIVAALGWLVKDISLTTGINIQTEIDPASDALPDTHRTGIYRVIQEALTNIARHSSASSAWLTLRIAHDQVAGTVTDNGAGFDSGAGRQEGLGLVVMQERILELGGHVQVVSTPGQGTRVEFCLPIPDQPEAADDSSSHRGRSQDRPHGIEISA